MRSTLVAAALVGAVAAVPAAPASAVERHTQCGSKQVKRSYSANYKKVRKTFSKRTPGRNILKFGLTDRKPSRCKDLARSNRTLRRWLAPPPAPIVSGDVAPTSSTTAPAATGGRYAIPSYIVECESGGSYTARNGVHYGAYQINVPLHYGEGGVCAGLDTSPAGQDACASRIWNSSGAGAWTCA